MLIGLCRRRCTLGYTFLLEHINLSLHIVYLCLVGCLCGFLCGNEGLQFGDLSQNDNISNYRSHVAAGNGFGRLTPDCSCCCGPGRASSAIP